MPRGGKRPGAGRPKGSKVKQKRTIAREMAEDILRQKIRKRIDPILEAQFSNAQGIKYLVVRNKKGGKFERVTEAMARVSLGSDEEIVEVWEKDPSVHAFKELLDRGYGKAKEPERNVNLHMPEMESIMARLVEGRKRVANGNRSKKR